MVGEERIPGVGKEGMSAGAKGPGLIPWFPISTDPNGIPARGIAPGDSGDVAADVDAAELAEFGQPVMVAVLPGSEVPIPVCSPPPSKALLVPDVPWDAVPSDE